MATTRRFTVLLALVLLLFAASAAARKLAGVQMPDRLDVAGKSLVLNGMGIREATILNVNVYVAGLYLETRSKNPTQILDSAQVKRLVLHFVREVDKDQVVDAWTEGFEKNAGKSAAALKPRIRRLNGWMRAFRPGDTLVFTCVPGAGVTVDISGATKGTIEGDDFTRGLLSIWLGPEPPNESLKEGLLGKR
jgi:hypothetical protein